MIMNLLSHLSNELIAMAKRVGLRIELLRNETVLIKKDVAMIPLPLKVYFVGITFIMITQGFASNGETRNEALNCDFLRADSFVSTADKELIRWTFPDGVHTTGSLVRHCFEQEGEQTVLIEWMAYDNPDVVLGMKSIALTIKNSKNRPYKANL